MAPNAVQEVLAEVVMIAFLNYTSVVQEKISTGHFGLVVCLGTWLHLGVWEHSWVLQQRKL